MSLLSYLGIGVTKRILIKEQVTTSSQNFNVGHFTFRHQSGKLFYVFLLFLISQSFVVPGVLPNSQQTSENIW